MLTSFERAKRFFSAVLVGGFLVTGAAAVGLATAPAPPAAATAPVAPSFVLAWGTPGSAQGQLDNPFNLTVDDSGNVFVVDTYNHRIQKFDGTDSS